MAAWNSSSAVAWSEGSCACWRLKYLGRIFCLHQYHLICKVVRGENEHSTGCLDARTLEM